MSDPDVGGRGPWLRATALVVATLALPVLPLWALITVMHSRLRRDLAERWGLRTAPAQPGSIWIHAASVGEIGAAEALIPHLDGPILLTADTDTGAARARSIAATQGTRVAGGVRPVDHPLVLAPLWSEARPRALVFVEGTYWPQLAARADWAGVPVLRVSAKVGRLTRAWARRWWYAPYTAAVRLTVCRDDDQARWFAGRGARVAVGGDLKGARPIPPNPLRWSRPFLVGASTRPGEEETLLEALPSLPGRPALLLAPRHPERFDRVAELLERSGQTWMRRSALPDGVVDEAVDVLLLDTLGELAGCLRGAAAAFVGGTFDPDVGGHSPAEAGRAGVPVVCGPHIESNRVAFQEVGAAVVARPEELVGALTEAIDSEPPVPWSNDAGVRTSECIAPWVRRLPAPEAAPRTWAWPVAWAWLGITWLRNLGYDLGLLRSVQLSVPVISVGSTNARGPGKSSTARWVAAQLASRGHRPGIALRGYRRLRPGRSIRLSTQYSTAVDLGDEAAVLARDGFLVASGPDRVEAGQALIQAGATVVVLDDGLQHRRLRRDLDLVVVDARFPLGRGPIPAGERREWAVVPRRASGVIAHHGAWPTEVPVARAHRRPGPWHRGKEPAPPPEGPVAAFAGIGRPADFRSSLEVAVGRFRALPDHEPIHEEDGARLVKWAGKLPMVCTAKDWVRLPQPLRKRVWWRDVVVEVEGAPDSWFDFPPPSRGQSE